MNVFLRFLILIFVSSWPIEAEDSSYLIGAYDQLEIRVFKEPDLSAVTRVQSDGSVLLPVVGNVVVAGMTEQQAVKIIENAFINGEVVQEPAVTLRIVRYASKHVAVLGFVMKPGSYFLDRPSTLSDLLARAGGAQVGAADFLYFSDFDPHTKKIMRHKVFIQHILGEGQEGVDFPIGDGDKVYVPRAPVFYIYGQVRQPGTYRLYPGMTAEQALATAGGVTDLGKASKIRKRNLNSGKMESIKLKALLGADDVLHVPERLF